MILRPLVGVFLYASENIEDEFHELPLFPVTGRMFDLGQRGVSWPAPHNKLLVVILNDLNQPQQCCEVLSSRLSRPSGQCRNR